jgi:hypothetical protein
LRDNLIAGWNLGRLGCDFCDCISFGGHNLGRLLILRECSWFFKRIFDIVRDRDDVFLYHGLGCLFAQKRDQFQILLAQEHRENHVEKQTEDDAKLNASGSGSLKPGGTRKKDNHQERHHSKPDEPVIKRSRIKEIFRRRENDSRHKTGKYQNGQVHRPNLFVEIA